MRGLQEPTRPLRSDLGWVPVRLLLLSSLLAPGRLNRLHVSSLNRRYLQRIFSLRQVYPTLLDGFQVSNYSTQTYEVLFPGSNATKTKSAFPLLT